MGGVRRPPLPGCTRFKGRLDHSGALAGRRAAATAVSTRGSSRFWHPASCGDGAAKAGVSCEREGSSFPVETASSSTSCEAAVTVGVLTRTAAVPDAKVGHKRQRGGVGTRSAPACKGTCHCFGGGATAVPHRPAKQPRGTHRGERTRNAVV